MTSTEILLGSVSKIIDCEHKTAPENKKEIYAYSVGTRALSSNTIDLDACKPIDEETYRTWSKKAEIEVGDIILAREAPVGGVGLVKFLDPKLCLGQRTVLIKPTRSMINSTYLSYLLQSKSIQNWFSEMSTGSTVLHLNVGDIKKLPLGNLPSLETQKTIAEILHSFDQKIELNDLISRTLEEIARTIFESWFIDFDPVKAKLGGEKPIGFEDSTLALFPDSLEESELGLMPSGWQAKFLGDLITPRRGKTITKSKCVDGVVPVVAGGLRPAYFHNTSNVSQPVVTVSASGANAGFVRLYLKDIWASDCSYINSEVTQSVFFWYLFLSRNQELIYSMQQGAAQPHIYPSDLMRLKLICPKSLDLVMKFEETVTPLFMEIGALERQNELLRSLRDSLLPRLISGELQIPEEMLAS